MAILVGSLSSVTWRFTSKSSHPLNVLSFYQEDIINTKSSILLLNHVGNKMGQHPLVGKEAQPANTESCISSQIYPRELWFLNDNKEGQIPFCPLCLPASGFPCEWKAVSKMTIELFCTWSRCLVWPWQLCCSPSIFVLCPCDLYLDCETLQYLPKVLNQLLA